MRLQKKIWLWVILLLFSLIVPSRKLLAQTITIEPKSTIGTEKLNTWYMDNLFPDAGFTNVHFLTFPDLTVYVDATGQGPGIKFDNPIGLELVGYQRTCPTGESVDQFFITHANDTTKLFPKAPSISYTPSSTDVGILTLHQVETGYGRVCNDPLGTHNFPSYEYNTSTITVEYPHFVNDTQIRNLCSSSPVLQLADYFSGNTSPTSPIQFYLDQTSGLPNASAITSLDPSKIPPGDHTVTAWKTYDNGVFQQTIPIHVISTTPVILGSYPSSICSNQGIFTISASPSGGTWTSTPAGAVDANGNVDPSKASAGAISLTYSYTDPNANANPSGCAATRRITIQVTQPPLPALISGLTQGCSGTPTTLTAHSDSAQQYNWYHLADQAPFATGASIKYTIQTSETLYCVAIGKNGCGLSRVASGSIQLTSLSPTANPTESETSIPFGGLVQFHSGNPLNATSYQWNFGDGESSPEENPSHYYYHAGTFKPTLYIASSQGCSGLVSLPPILVSPDDSAQRTATYPRLTGTDSLPQTVRVYPSPFTDHLYIGLKLKAPQSIGYQLMDISGRVVRSGSLEGVAGDNTFKLSDLGNLGLKNYYLLMLNSPEVQDVEKILKL